MAAHSHADAEESEIRRLVEKRPQAVRDRNREGILADHLAGMLMFDVPPPLPSVGLDSYSRTWDLFYASSPDPCPFDIQEMHVTAGVDVAVVTALMGCAVIEDGEAPAPRDSG